MCMSSAPQLPERPPHNPRKTINDAVEWWVLVEGRDPEDVAKSLEARADEIRMLSDHLEYKRDKLTNG